MSDQWVRNQPCPFCGSKSAYAVNLTTEGYICHRCSQTGSLKTLHADLDVDLKPIIHESKLKPEVERPDPTFSWDRLVQSKPGGMTDEYLSSRRIKPETWTDLELREGVITHMSANGPWYQKVKACYAFRDVMGRIVALHYVTHSRIGEKQKRYLGPKSLGVAILKEPEGKAWMIISEGLENALAFRQVKGSIRQGVCVAGDSGNMIKYARDHHISLLRYEYAIVEDGDPAGQKAAGIFRNTYDVKFREITLPQLDAVDLLLTDS